MAEQIVINEPAYGDRAAYKVIVHVEDGDEASGVRTAIAYMEAFNARDSDGTNDVINFPHIRLAQKGPPRIAETADDLMRPEVFEWLREQEEWHHSCWDHIRVVHASPEKVHLDVQFTRYREDGSVIGHYPSLWVMTCHKGVVGHPDSLELREVEERTCSALW